jgi:hypothetical protein
VEKEERAFDTPNTPNHNGLRKKNEKDEMNAIFASD